MSSRVAYCVVIPLTFASAPHAFAQPGATEPAEPPEPAGDGFEHHRGFTFEWGAGLFFAHLGDDQLGRPMADQMGFSLHDISLGWFLTRRVAITLRFANGFYTTPASDSSCWFSPYVFWNAFVGPSAQVWLDSHMWVGGGFGYSPFLEAVGCDYGLSTSGPALDLFARAPARPHDHAGSRLSAPVNVLASKGRVISAPCAPCARDARTARRRSRRGRGCSRRPGPSRGRRTDRRSCDMTCAP